MNPLVIGIIIVVGFLTAVILLAIYNSPQESTQPVQRPELTTQKTLVETPPFTCVGYECYVSWLNSYKEIFSPEYSRVNLLENFGNTAKIIKNHFQNQSVTIYDVRDEPVKLSNCEFGECQEIYKLLLLVSKENLNKMLELGFKVSENQTPETLEIVENQFKTIKVGNTNYSINYEITGGNLLSTIFEGGETKLFLNTTSDGKIVLKIPPVQQGPVEYCGESRFHVYTGRSITLYDGLANLTDRTLSFNFQMGTKEVHIAAVTMCNGMGSFVNPFQ